MTDSRRGRLLTAFSLLRAGVLGFFNLGATLTLVASQGGTGPLARLFATSWLHAPLEFFFVLTCVAEPLRLTLRRAHGYEMVKLLRADLPLLLICLVGILVSAAIEVFARLYRTPFR